MITFEKAPADTQDYDIDFNAWLTNLSDTGQSFTVETPSGITLVTSSLTAGVVKLWITSGDRDTKYTFLVNLTTTGGRVKQVRVLINVGS